MSRWGRYRKKPVVIEAMQLVGTNADTHAVYPCKPDIFAATYEPAEVVTL